jgi:hypothetical protein
VGRAQSTSALTQFKLHRGIEKALVFSPNPNEILLVGGRGHFEAHRSVVKVDLKKQTYIWECEVANEYNTPKGVQSNSEIFIFGGQKDVCEIYFHRNWKEGVFEHRKTIDIDDLEVFSCSKESLLVKAADLADTDEKPTEDEEIFFGNDSHPCLVLFTKQTGKVRRLPVPLAMRLKSDMEVIEYQKGMFMLLGGSDSTGLKTSRSCYFYDKLKNSAAATVKMTTKRVHFAALVSGNHIFVFGGYDPT